MLEGPLGFSFGSLKRAAFEFGLWGFIAFFTWSSIPKFQALI